MGFNLKTIIKFGVNILAITLTIYLLSREFNEYLSKLTHTSSFKDYIKPDKRMVIIFTKLIDRSIRNPVGSLIEIHSKICAEYCKCRGGGDPGFMHSIRQSIHTLHSSSKESVLQSIWWMQSIHTLHQISLDSGVQRIWWLQSIHTLQ